MHGEPLDREIAVWREKMHVALLRYEAARQETRKIDHMRMQRLLPSPDGAVAYNKGPRGRRGFCRGLLGELARRRSLQRRWNGETVHFLTSDLIGISAGFVLFSLLAFFPGYAIGWLTNVFEFRSRLLPFRLAASV